MKKFPNFRGSKTPLPTRKHGLLQIESEYFSGAIDGDIIVFFGNPLAVENPLVRIHSECVFAEVFDSAICDCKDQLDLVFERFKIEKHGILVYLRIDGRGEGLSAKVRATKLEINGEDTFESRVKIGVSPDSRKYKEIGQYIYSKGIKKIRLLSNNPEKIDGMTAVGIEVVAEPLIISTSSHEIRRLYASKAIRFKHLIPAEYYEESKNIFEQINIEFPYDKQD